MEKFLLVYYGGKQPPPEKKDMVMQDWMNWFQAQGKMVVDQGNPTMPGKTIGPRGGVKPGVIGEPVTGYSIIIAASLDAAVAAAKTNPQLKAGGEIAVYSIMNLM